MPITQTSKDKNKTLEKIGKPYGNRHFFFLSAKFCCKGEQPVTTPLRAARVCVCEDYQVLLTPKSATTRELCVRRVSFFYTGRAIF